MVQIRTFEELLCAVLALWSTTPSWSIVEFAIEFFDQTTNAKTDEISRPCSIQNLREIFQKKTTPNENGFWTYFARFASKRTQFEYHSLLLNCRKNIINFLRCKLVQEFLLRIGAFTFTTKILDAYTKMIPTNAPFRKPLEWKLVAPRELCKLYQKYFLVFIGRDGTCYHVPFDLNSDIHSYFSSWMDSIEKSIEKTAKTYTDILLNMIKIHPKPEICPLLYVPITTDVPLSTKKVLWVCADYKGRFWVLGKEGEFWVLDEDGEFFVLY